MSRGRRDVRRSFTTLLVLGSMTMMLLVFSLLTKIRPVSLANAAGHGPAANAAAKPTANRRRRGTKGSLHLRLRKWLRAAYDLSKRRCKACAERPRRPRHEPAAREGTLLMDERARRADTTPALLLD